MSGKPGSEDIEERLEQDTRDTPFQPEGEKDARAEADTAPADAHPVTNPPADTSAKPTPVEEAEDGTAAKEDVSDTPGAQQEQERPEDPDGDEVVSAQDETGATAEEEAGAPAEEEAAPEGGLDTEQPGGDGPDENEDASAEEDDPLSFGGEDDAGTDDENAEPAEEPTGEPEPGDAPTITFDGANSGVFAAGNDSGREVPTITAGGSGGGIVISAGSTTGDDDSVTITAGGSDRGVVISADGATSDGSLHFGTGQGNNVGTLEPNPDPDPAFDDPDDETVLEGAPPAEDEQTSEQEEAPGEDGAAEAGATEPAGEKPSDEEGDVNEPIDFTPEPEPKPEGEKETRPDEDEGAEQEDSGRPDLSGGESRSILDAIDVFTGHDDSKDSFDGGADAERDQDDDDDDLDDIF